MTDRRKPRPVSGMTRSPGTTEMATPARRRGGFGSARLLSSGMALALTLGACAPADPYAVPLIAFRRILSGFSTAPGPS